MYQYIYTTSLYQWYVTPSWSLSIHLLDQMTVEFFSPKCDSLKFKACASRSLQWNAPKGWLLRYLPLLNPLPQIITDPIVITIIIMNIVFMIVVLLVTEVRCNEFQAAATAEQETLWPPVALELRHLHHRCHHCHHSFQCQDNYHHENRDGFPCSPVIIVILIKIVDNKLTKKRYWHMKRESCWDWCMLHLLQCSFHTVTRWTRYGLEIAEDWPMIILWSGDNHW